MKMIQKIKSLFGAQDMTHGNILKCLVEFSIPLLIGNFAQMMYSTVDSIIVGKYVGDAALSAIGTSTPIQFLFLVFYMAIGSGVMIMVSQYYGAHEYEELADSIGNSITLITIVSVFVSFFGVLLTDSMLRMVNTPAETFDMAHTYLVILFIGAAGNGFYNIMAGILRGMGESIFPLLVLLATTVINIVLDIWFIAGLDMGVAGAAWATIIAQILSAIACLLKVVLKKNELKISLKHLRLKRRVVYQIAHLGIPTGVSQAIMFIGSIVVQSLVNSMGYMVAAAITAVMRVDGFAVLPSNTFSIAAATFTGQNTGAGFHDRVKRGSWTVFFMSLCFSAVMLVLMVVFGPWLMGLFTDTQSLIDMGTRFIRIMLPAYLLMCVSQSFGGVMRGAGDPMTPMWIAIVSNIIIRIPLAYLLSYLTISEIHPAGNPDSIFISLVIAILIGAIMTGICYRAGKWKGKGITKQSRNADA